MLPFSQAATIHSITASATVKIHMAFSKNRCLQMVHPKKSYEKAMLETMARGRYLDPIIAIVSLSKLYHSTWRGYAGAMPRGLHLVPIMTENCSLGMEGYAGD